MDADDLELLPVLVADLASDDARELLESVAADRGKMIVPLVAPPGDASKHRLEVYSPGFEQALVLLAEPMGPPTKDGFPLRLSFSPHAPRGDVLTARFANVSEPPRVEPKRITTHTLTESHERRLTGGKPREPVRITGRKLASGKLVIETFVGSGGAGAVYKAMHRDLQIPVAVKVLHEELQRDVDFCRRFHAEALAASRLDHANLTRVIDFGQEPDGTLYLAMEFLAGRVLRDVIEKEGRFPLARTLGIMAQLCAGLAHAHVRGVLHRDVKPENVVLMPSSDDDGRAFELVKVCDFGIAQQPAEGSDEVAGTPEYMAPELCAGEDVDARADIYACGVMLYELVTGRLPFEGTTAQLLNRHMYRAPEPPSKHAPEVDPRLEAIILQSLEKDRAKRPVDMRELRAMLRSLRPSSPALPKVSVPSVAPTSSSASALAQIEPESEPEPEWLERSGAWAAHVPEQSPKPPGAKIEDPVVAALVKDPTTLLGQLVKTRDPHAFHRLAVAIDPAIRTLASRAESAVLWRLTTALDALADEGPRTPGSRAAMAALLLRIAYDPQVLAPIAEDALVSDRQTLDAAWKLMVRASTGGVYALYQARLKHAAPEARRRFVHLYRQIGAPVLPVVRAGLEKLAPRIEAGGAAVDLAFDLLETTPSAADEATGEVIAVYARARIPALACAAAAAIVRVWGARSCPALVGLLSHQDEAVQCAAIRGLVDIHAVDEPVARKLTSLVGAGASGKAARVVAIEALASAQPSGRPFAGRALRRMLAAVTDSWPDELVLAVARSLLAVGEPDDRRLIADRARSWRPPLSTATLALIATP